MKISDAEREPEHKNLSNGKTMTDLKSAADVDSDVKSGKNGADHHDGQDEAVNTNGIQADDDHEMKEDSDDNVKENGDDEKSVNNDEAMDTNENASAEPSTDTTAAADAPAVEDTTATEDATAVKDSTAAQDSNAVADSKSKTDSKDCEKVDQDAKDTSFEESADDSTKRTTDDEASSITMQGGEKNEASSNAVCTGDKNDDTDLKKLKTDGELKMQLDDGETFEVQMISSGESEDEEDSSDESSRPDSVPVASDKSEKSVTVIPSQSEVITSVSKIQIPASSVPIRPSQTVHRPSILAHSQVYRDSKGNVVRKPTPVVKSSSASNVQQTIYLQQTKPQGPTNEELAIEFNKQSRKKLTINNLIDALKEFGVDLEYLKEVDGEKKDKMEEKEKKDGDEQSEKKESDESKSADKEKDVKKEKPDTKTDDGEKKPEKTEEEVVEVKDEADKVKGEKEETSSPARRSSRRASRAAEKEKETSTKPSRKKDSKKSQENDTTDEKDSKSAEPSVKETKESDEKENKEQATDDKKSVKKEEVVIESDDEKENKKRKAEEEEADADVASHGDVAKKLRPVAKFLYFTGLDFSREVVYSDLVSAGERKHKKLKLDGSEIHDLQQMKKLYVSLKQKNKRLRPKQIRVCKQCPFSTESESVMYFHRQQGHLDDRNLKWSCAMCEFESRAVQTFVFHMEAEHNMTALPHPRPQFFMCSICSYNSSTKSHLAKHVMKCEKQFQPDKHQFPLYDDINFIFRALPGPLIKIPQQQPVVRPPPPQQPQYRQIGQPRILLPPGAVPILPRQPVYRPLPNMRPAPILGTGRSRYPPQTAQQFISNTIQQMKIVPQGQPIVIKDGPVTASGVTTTASAAPKTPVQAAVKRPATVANLTVSGASKPKTGKYSYEVCEICGGFVLDRQALRLHFAMAHNINLREDALDVNRSPPLSCDFCTSRFFTFQGLSLHKARSNHARADQALCHICNTLTSDMPSHIKSAHNIVPNQLNTIRICPICGQCVLTEKTEAHIERVHNIKLDKPVTMTAKPVYGCSQCTAQFTERSLLNLHIRKGHPPPPNKKCPICGVYTKTAVYTRHVLVAHCCKKLEVKLTRCDDEKANNKPVEVINLDTPVKASQDNGINPDEPEKEENSESENVDETEKDVESPKVETEEAPMDTTSD